MVSRPPRKPEIPPDVVIRVVNQTYGKVLFWDQSLHGYDDQNCLLREGEHEASCSRYVFKISNPEYYTKDVLRLGIEMQQHLCSHGSIVCPHPIPSQVNAQYLIEFEFESVKYLGRLITFVEGKLLRTFIDEVGLTFFETLGEYVGQVSLNLSHFHSDVKDFKWTWDALTGPPIVSQFLNAIDDPDQQNYAREILCTRYKKFVLSKQDGLRSGFIHNDINFDNVIVKKMETAADKSSPLDRNLQIIGLIDFGDVLYRKYVFELSVVIAYGVQGATNPVNVARALCKGYCRSFPLNDEELQVLYPLITMRLMISFTMGAVKRKQYPSDSYLTRCVDPAWQALLKLEENSVEEWHQIFTDCC